MDVEISCMCLNFKTKLFWRCIAIVMDRDKAEILRFNDMQMNQLYNIKSLQSKYFNHEF